MKAISINLVSNIAVINFELQKIISDQDIAAVGKGFDEVALDVVKVILNFSNVQFFSSAMIGRIIMFRKKIGGDNLKLCCLQPTIRDVFSITRLDKLMPIYDTEEDAIGAYMKEDK